VSGQLHAPAALPPGKVPPVSIGYKAGWAPEPIWTLWRRAKLNNNNNNNNNSILVYLRANSPEANYEVSTSKKKVGTKYKTRPFI
jgi:hypothetical protein